MSSSFADLHGLGSRRWFFFISSWVILLTFPNDFDENDITEHSILKTVSDNAVDADMKIKAEVIADRMLAFTMVLLRR